MIEKCCLETEEIKSHLETSNWFAKQNTDFLENPPALGGERAVGSEGHGGEEDGGEGTSDTARSQTAAVAGETMGGMAGNLVKKALTTSAPCGQSCPTCSRGTRIYTGQKMVQPPPSKFPNCVKKSVFQSEMGGETKPVSTL